MLICVKQHILSTFYPKPPVAHLTNFYLFPVPPI